MSDVSRETATAPPAPDSVRGVFAAERLALIREYADLLVRDGVIRGLIGPREAPRIWDRHLLNSAALAEAIGPDVTVADVGSGAGLPGVVLAIARPDLRVTLVEPLVRRSTFLTEVVDELGLTNVEVVRARVEDLHARDEVAPGFDVVTSRAVANLDKLLDWCLPLVAPTGQFLALKGDRAEAEVAESASVLSQWDVEPAEVVTLGAGVLDDPTYAVRVRWSDPASVAWPPAKQRSRRAGRRRGRR